MRGKEISRSHTSRPPPPPLNFDSISMGLLRLLRRFTTTKWACLLSDRALTQGETIRGQARLRDNSKRRILPPVKATRILENWILDENAPQLERLGGEGGHRRDRSLHVLAKLHAWLIRVRACTWLYRRGTRGTIDDSRYTLRYNRREMSLVKSGLRC